MKSIAIFVALALTAATAQAGDLEDFAARTQHLVNQKPESAADYAQGLVDAQGFEARLQRALKNTDISAECLYSEIPKAFGGHEVSCNLSMPAGHNFTEMREFRANVHQATRQLSKQYKKPFTLNALAGGGLLATFTYDPYFGITPHYIWRE